MDAAFAAWPGLMPIKAGPLAWHGVGCEVQVRWRVVRTLSVDEVI